MKNNKKAFTLVELIVVITILAILWTIWFVSYSRYLVWTRDTNRVSQLATIYDWLEVYRTKNDLPKPENSVEIQASGSVIWYQWYMWKNNLTMIEYSKWWVDPKDGTYFTYYVTKDNRNFQLMAYLEDESNKQLVKNQNTKEMTQFLIPQVNAWVDYTNRYPTLYWKQLGILTESVTNTPIQEVSTIITNWYLDVATTTDWYTLNFTDTDTLTSTWYALYSAMAVRNWDKAPDTCPDWFISVPWNLEFHKEWFCVAKYEMSYDDADTPDSCDQLYPTTCTTNQDWNTVRYQVWKSIVSKLWKYPIANIKQQQAIDACRSMWVWYHLITNNEWMTIARNIEQVTTNWSWKKVWVWYIYNWVSNSTMWCNGVTNTIYTLPISTRVRASKTWEWNTGTWISTCNPYRQHTLTNWQVIWDLSGNVWEHVNKANTIEVNFASWQTSVAWSSNNTNWDNDGIYDTSDMKKYGSSLWLWTANGMWNIYYASWVTNNIFIRWGDGNAYYLSGIFAVMLTRTSTN